MSGEKGCSEDFCPPAAPRGDRHSFKPRFPLHLVSLMCTKTLSPPPQRLLLLLAEAALGFPARFGPADAGALRDVSSHLPPRAASSQPHPKPSRTPRVPPLSLSLATGCWVSTQPVLGTAGFHGKEPTSNYPG